MSTITVLAPDYEAAKPAEVVPAPRSVPTDPVTITVIDNGKPNAGLLLSRLADRLAQRTGAQVVLTETKNAATACDEGVLRTITEEVDLVLTGSAD